MPTEASNKAWMKFREKKAIGNLLEWFYAGFNSSALVEKETHLNLEKIWATFVNVHFKNIAPEKLSYGKAVFLEGLHAGLKDKDGINKLQKIDLKEFLKK